MLRGLQLWVGAINHRGGLNGHPVKLLTYDDGGDPARHRSHVQEAIEGQKVLGFVNNADVISGRQGTTDYITSQRVPIIGEDGGQDFAYTSPMAFPHVSAGRPYYRTIIPAAATQLVSKGKTKLGILACVEADACGQLISAAEQDAKSVGFEIVYQGRASLAQPDFTAACLSARNAGAQVLYAPLDENSLYRLAAGCARQGYRPTYVMVGQGTADRQKDDPNFEGAVSTSSVFPYFQSGTPATDEFQRVVSEAGRDLSIGAPVAHGWAAGKLVEKAGAALPEPPTREALLEGLWSIQDDTLGGLTAPLTFVRDQPPKAFSCWFTVMVIDKQWTSPESTFQCR